MSGNGAGIVAKAGMLENDAPADLSLS